MDDDKSPFDRAVERGYQRGWLDGVEEMRKAAVLIVRQCQEADPSLDKLADAIERFGVE
jgi:hypothetical protein